MHFEIAGAENIKAFSSHRVAKAERKKFCGSEPLREK